MECRSAQRGAAQPPVNTEQGFGIFQQACPAAPQASGARMGLQWGGAADEQNVYFELTSGGMVALRLATGKGVWGTPLTSETGGRLSNGAAAAAIPGVTFVGGSDGVLHALAISDGRKLWSYATARRFDTVNRVEAKGGSIGAIGPTIVGGRVFIGSGYAVLGGGQSGNLLLSFGVD